MTPGIAVGIAAGLAAGMRRRTARGLAGPERDRGAVLVEFAGLFPMILVMLAAIWQCIIIGYTFSLAGNAADEAARAAAGSGGAVCAEAAREHLPDAFDARISCSLQGHVRTAQVDITVPVLFPGALNLPLTLTGTAGAAAEG